MFGCLCAGVTQVFDTNNTGPLYQLSGASLTRVHWHRSEKMRAFMYTIDVYVRSNRWNTIDVAIIVCSILSFSLRYALPPSSFQIDRFCFALTIVVCYFRLLRFWFVLPNIGPRIIAIRMMVTHSTVVTRPLYSIGCGRAFVRPHEAQASRPISDANASDYQWRLRIAAAASVASQQ